MEMVDIQREACAFPRVGNARIDSDKVGPKRVEQSPEDGVRKRVAGGDSDGGAADVGGGGSGSNRLHGWHQSRIIRVSRASGGKDRHSKVWTSKGQRDRRVRLSVGTAIQFYDLQDRLGYDQPSKAVEWLIKAAADSIAELPPLNHVFPDTPKQLSDEKRVSDATDHGLDSSEAELDGETIYQQNQGSQHHSLSKSACSSNSETSKCSGLSLSRSEVRVNRVKARERARERTAKEKEKEQESRCSPNGNPQPISPNPSFTELLTSGIGGVNSNTTPSSPTGSVQQNADGEQILLHRCATAAVRQWPSTPMDYFTTSGILGHSSLSSRPHQSAGVSGQICTGSSHSLPQTMSFTPLTLSSENQVELQHFSFVPDHLISAAGGDYNLNFTMTSGLGGFNRGTLQSNSASLLPHHQRFPPIDGSSVPFFSGAPASAAPPLENQHHHHLSPAFDSRLLLCYAADGSRHSDQKGKGKI